MFDYALICILSSGMQRQNPATDMDLPDHQTRTGYDTEALLVDDDLADQVWELWNAGVITHGEAAWAWRIFAQYDRLEID